jgi:hypothetical protein
MIFDNKHKNATRAKKKTRYYCPKISKMGQNEIEMIKVYQNGSEFDVIASF